MKLADGSVTNTELQYIGTLTSNVQNQITEIAKQLLVVQFCTADTIIDAQTQLAIITPAAGTAVTITLPAANLAGAQLKLKRNNSTTGTITIIGTIDGSANRTMNTAYQTLSLVADGTQWLLIN